MTKKSASESTAAIYLGQISILTPWGLPPPRRLPTLRRQTFLEQLLLKCPGRPQPQHFADAPANTCVLLEATRDGSRGPALVHLSDGGSHPPLSLSLSLSLSLANDNISSITATTLHKSFRDRGLSNNAVWLKTRA
jgi:hypothetical protein